MTDVAGCVGAQPNDGTAPSSSESFAPVLHDDAIPWRRRGFVPGDADPRDAALHECIVGSTHIWRGGVIDVESLEVTTPAGVREMRDVARHPGGVGVVALTEDGRVALVRQYRTPFDAVTVEIPAGKLDPGERDPEAAARRELRGEAGLVAKELRPLTAVAPSPGYTDEVVRVYLARGLSFVGTDRDDDEFIDVDLVPLDELVRAVLAGDLTDAKTVAGVLAAHALMGQEG